MSMDGDLMAEREHKENPPFSDAQRQAMQDVKKPAKKTAAKKTAAKKAPAKKAAAKK